MRIATVETRVLRHRLRETFGFSQWWYDTRASMLVKITTAADLGIEIDEARLAAWL